MAIAALFWLIVLACARGIAGHLLIDSSEVDQPFHGIGALSAGAATRLLVDYVEPQRSEILDLLFKPNHGASLQVLKVEIGGDSQSTDGTESSHMHSADDLNYERGYEWWLLAEAKKRNPDIKTSCLPWAFPRWVGGPEKSGSPFQHPDLTSKYVLKWLEGARDVYGIDIDSVGVWNERASDATYVKTLRKTLNMGGFGNTTIVARDGDAGICKDLAKDKEYATAVGAIGLHYPSDYEDLSACRRLGFGLKGGKPIWSSEESSSYDDLNGAACWARVVTSHYVLEGMTSSIIWNILAANAHGTGWYGTGLFTAVEPWSGHYEALEVLWATAHITQFTKVGWDYLRVGAGSGQLPLGGFYTTFADPLSQDWTLLLVKVDHDHAACVRPALPHFTVAEENVTFQLAAHMRSTSRLSVWYSNFQQTDGSGRALHLFERLADIEVSDSSFQLHVPVGAVYTVSTVVKGPATGPYPKVPASQPSFPLPYYDDFEKYSESQEASFWTDQTGVFEVHRDTGGNRVMRQMVPEAPIGWADRGKGPLSVLGMREWQDIEFSAWVRLPTDSPSGAIVCIGTRVDQMWENGLALCLEAVTGTWTFGLGGPRAGGKANNTYGMGTVSPVPLGTFARMTLRTVGGKAWGWLEAPAGAAQQSIFEATAVRDIDVGFAAIGTNGWFSADFDDVSVAAVGPNWHPSTPCSTLPASGTQLRLRRCATNGLRVPDQAFEILSNWAIRHVASGLCAAAGLPTSHAQDPVPVVLTACNAADPRQQFRNHYSEVRNMESEFYLGGALLTGHIADLTLTVEPKSKGEGRDGDHRLVQAWSYFPNSQQFRDQFTSSEQLGYPLCLSTCAEQTVPVAYI